MAEALTKAQLSQVEQQLMQNPAILQALQADDKKLGGRFQYTNSHDPRARQTPSVVLKQYGIDFPDAADYQIQVDPSGRVQLKRSNWFQRNSDWILPVATIGTAGIAALAAPAAAGTSAGSTVAGTSAGGTAAGTTAATAGGSSILHSLLPSLISTGTSLAGAAITAHGQSEALKAQTDASDKALKVQQEQYALQRQDSAPYRALGQGAVGNLGFLSGIDVDSKATALSATTPTTPYGQTAPPAASTPAPAPAPSLSTLGQPPPAQGSDPMVRIYSPSGTIGQVPQSKLQAALAAGGRMA